MSRWSIRGTNADVVDLAVGVTLLGERTGVDDPVSECLVELHVGAAAEIPPGAVANRVNVSERSALAGATEPRP